MELGIQKFESDSKKPHKIKNPILLRIRALKKEIDKLQEQHKKQVRAKLQKKLQHLNK